MKTMIHSNRILATISGLVLFGEQTHARLLTYYSFDTGFTDTSGNNNDLVIANGTPSVTSTPSELVFGSGALDIDSTTGDQAYLNLATPINFEAGSPWSVSFWARHRPGNDGRTGMILGNLATTDFIWTPRDGAVDGLRFRNSDTQNADYTTPPAGVEPAGVYHHWAVVADGGGNLEVFYDNVSLGMTTIATTFDITSVGQAFNSNIQSMNGQIDELYIFNEALDAPAVENLFNNIKDTTPPTLTTSDIVDNQGGGSVAENNTITYTITFSEEINPDTVGVSDFGNAGSAPLTIAAASETAPGVFSVTAIPTGIGSLQLEVSAGAQILDGWGNPFDATTATIDDTIITVTENTEAPTTSSMSPMAGATNLSPFDDLTLTFNKFVQVGTGNITIHLSDGTLVETINVNSGSVSITDAEVTINPPGDLQALTTYYLNITAGAFEDLSGNDFAGITNNSTWTFTTGSLLFARYTFDSDFADSSGYGNDLTAEPGTDPMITIADGDFKVGGGALDLDGDDWLNMLTTLNFRATEAWSVAFWAKRGATSATQDGMILGEAGSSGNFIWIPDNSAVLQGLRFRNQSGANADFGGIPDDGAYHHWAVIADGAGNITTYRDNVALTTLAPTDGTAFTAANVGQAFNQTGQIHLGQIDELHIYREAIDPAAVNQLFNADGSASNPQITSMTSIGSGVWELTLTGARTTNYEFRSSTTLDFSPGNLIENLTQGNAGDPGSIGGINNSVIMTDNRGDATVRMTLSSSPADYVRAVKP